MRGGADRLHLQQRPDQVVHASGGLAQARQVVAAGVVDLVRIGLAEQAAESLDRPQRRAQVVGDAVSERLELLVGVREFARAQRDAGLEGAVERLLARVRQYPFGDVLDLDQARPVLPDLARDRRVGQGREEQTSELQTLMRKSY